MTRQKWCIVQAKQYEGVGGHLFAIGAEISLNNGYGGAMYGFAANKELANLYVEKYGADFMPYEHPYEIFFSEQVALKLLEIYNYERQ